LVCHFVDAIVGHVTYRNGAGARGFEIYIVHTNAVTNDGAGLRHRVDDVRVYAGELRDYYVGVGDVRDEFRLVFARARDNFVTDRLEDGFLNGEVGESPIRDHNLTRLSGRDSLGGRGNYVSLANAASASGTSKLYPINAEFHRFAQRTRADGATFRAGEWARDFWGRSSAGR
jgi:hypothetical protein